jgi:xanthine dehydrogenase accessory factor
VSGGCVEDDLIARVKGGERSDKPSMIAYGVTKAEAARFGIPCGGSLRLVQEPVTDTAWIAQILQRTAAHELVARTLTLANGTVTLTPAQRSAATLLHLMALRSKPSSAPSGACC